MGENYFGKTCPYCQYPIKQSAEIAVCSVCLIPHHASCWQENAGCTTFGCKGIPSYLPSDDTTIIGKDEYNDQRLTVDIEGPVNLSRQFLKSSPNTESKGNVLGIISFIICVLIALVFLLQIFNQAFSVSNEVLIFISLFALTLGSIGFFQLNQRRVFAGLGVFLSLFFIGIAVTGYFSDSGDELINPGDVSENDDLNRSLNGDHTRSFISVPADYPTIQSAINDALPGDVIVVAEGIYKENINFQGKDLVVRSTDPEDPSVVANTVIDGDHKGTVVTFANSESRDAVLNGFTITGGTGTRDSYTIMTYDGERLNFQRRYGGGILVAGNSEPVIANNILINNSARNVTADVVGVGGGIAVLDGSAPLIENNTINNNYAEAFGGGIAVWYKSYPVIRNNIVENNRTDDIGGGIMVAMMCSPVISDNKVSNNHSSNWAGGIYVAHMSDAKIFGNLIEQNFAFTGAGIFVRRTDGVTVKENELIGNQALKNGGAIYIDNRSTATVEKNHIVGNKADSGGAIWVDSDSRVLLSTPDSNSYRNNIPDNILRK